jgi:beta-lactamase regulating signal transducer with metallopeptidase domain
MQVLTHFPLLKALGWALFNSLWQMAALWLLYRLIIAIFHTVAADVRHGLALLFLVIGACWTGATFVAASLFSDTGNNTWLSVLSPEQSAPALFWHTGKTLMDTTLSFGSTLYLVVLAGLILRYISHYWHTRKLTRSGLVAMPAEFRVFVKATALQLNIGKPVRAWLSHLIDVPLTLGFLKPVILLPAAMITQLSPHQVEAILIHELGHIRRKDYLLHLVVTVLEGLLFFNPFSRLLIRELKKEREHCCDDLVLQFKYNPHDYISALLVLAARQRRGQKLAVAATGGSDKLLLQRARRILLQQEDDRSGPRTRTLVLLLFTGLITALAFCRPLHPAQHTGTVNGPAGIDAPAKTAPASVPVANSREFAFSRPIYSTRPRSAVAKPLRARPRTHTYRESEAPEPGDNDVFINLADDPTGDGNIPALASTSDELTDPGSAPEFENRDYSMKVPGFIAGPDVSFPQGAPIVPNSSFSFRYTEGDSSRPEEQLLYLQQSAQREVLSAIVNLQQQTAVQLKALAALQAKAAESVHLRHQIQTQQQSIQREYLKKITGWQKKLETTTHIRMIVYI